jgi:hypothetical protein
VDGGELIELVKKLMGYVIQIIPKVTLKNGVSP